MSREEAYEIIRSMKGKLEMPLVVAFRECSAESLNQQATSTAIGMSKGDSQTQPRAPDDAAALFGAAEQQLETGRHLGLPRDLEARAAR